MTDWQLVLLTAFVTTLGTGLVTYVGHRLTVSKDTQEERGRHARYLAIRVVCILDNFVAGCSEIVADGGEYDAEACLRTTVDYPTLQFPDDVDWRSISPNLMYRLLALPNDLDSAHKSIHYMGNEVSSPPDFEEFFEERKYQFGKLGLAALALCDEIRETFEIPPHDYGVGWHPKPWFEKATVEVDRMWKQAAESAANLIRMHNEKVARGEADNLVPVPPMPAGDSSSQRQHD